MKEIISPQTDTNQGGSLSPFLRMQALTYNNIGCLLAKEQSYEKALGYLLQTLELQIKSQYSQFQISTTCMNLASVLSKLGKHRQALDNSKQAISILRNALLFHQEEKNEEADDGKSKQANSGRKQQSNQLLPPLSSRRNVDKSQILWKLAVASNNCGVEHQYLKKQVARQIHNELFLISYGQALQMYKTAYELCLNLNGSEHTKTQQFKKSYETLKSAIHNRQSNKIVKLDENSSLSRVSKSSLNFYSTPNQASSFLSIKKDYKSNNSVKSKSTTNKSKNSQLSSTRSFVILEGKADNQKIKILEKQAELMSSRIKQFQKEQSKRNLAIWKATIKQKNASTRPQSAKFAAVSKLNNKMSKSRLNNRPDIDSPLNKSPFETKSLRASKTSCFFNPNNMKLISGVQSQKVNIGLQQNSIGNFRNKTIHNRSSSNQRGKQRAPLLEGKGRKGLLQIMGQPGQPIWGDHKLKAKYRANQLMPSQSKKALQAKRDKSTKIGYGGFIAPVEAVAQFLNQKLIKLQDNSAKVNQSEAAMRKSSSKIGNLWNHSFNNPYTKEDKTKRFQINKIFGRKSEKNFRKNDSHDEMYQNAGKKLRSLFKQNAKI